MKKKIFSFSLSFSSSPLLRPPLSVPARTPQMCRVPVKALPAGTYCPPTWLNEQVTLPAISDAELSMLDSLLNVKPEDVASAAATASTQQQPIAFVAPPPPAFLANVFPAYGAVTHANAPAYAAQASLENRAKRVKKVREK